MKPMQPAAFMRNTWTVRCRDANGRLRWVERYVNLIPTEALNYLLEAGLRGGTQIATWYVGLIASTGTPSLVAGDTGAQIGGTNGWSEFTSYTGSTRKALTIAAAAAGAAVATTVSFAINANSTVAGAFMVSSSSGASGTLYGEGLFAAAQAVINGDTVEIDVTAQAVSG